MSSNTWLVIAIACLIGACGRGAAPPPASAAEVAPREHTAVAQLAGGSEAAPIEGEVVFTEVEGGGLQIEATIAGLEPGEHGFHIHEVGECTAPGFESAGPHFATEGEHHAGPEDPGRHLGDLGNIEVGPDGTARISVREDGLRLGAGGDSVVGKSIVVHAKRDDFETQPSGDSGARIACGVILPR